MRRFHPLCLLAAVLVSLSGCGESPSRPSVVTDRPVNPPKTSARYIQVPWDISLFFNIPGGAIVTGATTAATPGAAAEGDNLTGTYSNSNGFAGTLTGVLTGTLESGTFNGSLLAITPSGCTAERRYSGSVNSEALNWTPGNHVNDCNGTSPLTSGIQVIAAPANSPPPCTYSSTASATSFTATGGSGTLTVTAGTGCLWFASSSAGFVTLSASQGTGNGSVQFTVAANPSTVERTAIVAVAGQSFTITQAAAPAPPVCTYALNGSAITVEAAGALAGVDMRAAAGCAWQAQSDASWLRITGGAGGTGNGTISLAIDANPGLAERVGRITTTGGQVFTVTQNGIACTFTATATPLQFDHTGGSGTITVETQPVCQWQPSTAEPWILFPPPPTRTGSGSRGFTIAANPGPGARTGTFSVAGVSFTVTQSAPPVTCTYTLKPSQTTFDAAGGTGSIAIATQAGCAWSAVAAGGFVTITGPATGTGTGSVAFSVAANPGATRTGSITIADIPTTITQNAPTTGTVSGTVLSAATGGPIPGGAIVRVGNLAATTNASGAYTLPNVPLGTQTISAEALEHVTQSVTVPVTFQTTQDFRLNRGTPALVFTFTPNPQPPDPENPRCGDPELWCWSFAATVRNTGVVGFTVTSWELNQYNVEGGLYTTTRYSAADFPRFFNGATGVPALGTASGGGIVFFDGPDGGTLEIVLNGVDSFNRAQTFTSAPRLTLSPHDIGTAPRDARPTRKVPPRPRR